jgi:hypothetical protein
MRKPDCAKLRNLALYEFTPEDQFGIMGIYVTKNTRKGRLARSGAHLPWRHCGDPLRGPAMCCFFEGGSSASLVLMIYLISVTTLHFLTPQAR